MVPGSVRFFRAMGINVLVHWSWLGVAFLILVMSQQHFSSVLWGLLLYVALFVIVLLHEFGHALACRSIGGRAELILVSLVGGAAFMETPQKPGAVLWSVLAGPLVNIVLIPVSAIGYILVRGGVAFPIAGNDPQVFLFFLFAINLFLLVYNMLPIYPMDGGQALVALLWPVLGRPRAMRVVGVIGLVTAGAALVTVALIGEVILMLLSAYAGWRAWLGYQMGHAMQQADPSAYDDRHKEQDVEQRIQSQVDPWRR